MHVFHCLQPLRCGERRHYLPVLSQSQASILGISIVKDKGIDQEIGGIPAPYLVRTCKRDLILDTISIGIPGGKCLHHRHEFLRGGGNLQFQVIQPGLVDPAPERHIVPVLREPAEQGINMAVRAGDGRQDHIHIFRIFLLQGIDVRHQGSICQILLQRQEYTCCPILGNLCTRHVHHDHVRHVTGSIGHQGYLRLGIIGISGKEHELNLYIEILLYLLCHVVGLIVLHQCILLQGNGNLPGFPTVSGLLGRTILHRAACIPCTSLPSFPSRCIPWFVTTPHRECPQGQGQHKGQQSLFPQFPFPFPQFFPFHLLHTVPPCSLVFSPYHRSSIPGQYQFHMKYVKMEEWEPFLLCFFYISSCFF